MRDTFAHRVAANETVRPPKIIVPWKMRTGFTTVIDIPAIRLRHACPVDQSLSREQARVNLDTFAREIRAIEAVFGGTVQASRSHDERLIAENNSLVGEHEENERARSYRNRQQQNSSVHGNDRTLGKHRACRHHEEHAREKERDRHLGDARYQIKESQKREQTRSLRSLSNEKQGRQRDEEADESESTVNPRAGRAKGDISLAHEVHYHPDCRQSTEP